MKPNSAISSQKKTLWAGLSFTVLFVIQQLIAFTWKPFNLVTPYWIFYLLVIMVIAINNWNKIVQQKDAFVFFLVTAIGSFFSFFVGEKIGVCEEKAICSFVGLVGLCYLNSHRINLKVFEITFILLYVYFTFSYFVLDISVRLDLDDHMFGISSSNTIAIILNVVWILYYIIAKSYGNNVKQKSLLVISIINLIAIVLQGSRIGIVVAAINCFLSVSDYVKIIRRYFLVVVFFGAYLFLNYGSSLGEIMEFQQMQGLESYNEDVRSQTQAAFFSKLSFINGLFGFPNSTRFAGWNRTFNAFLDYWRQFGGVAFAFLVFFIIKRVVKNKQYYVPLVAFVSLFVYSFIESIWGATLFDVLIYITLFYSNEKSFVFFEEEAKKAS